MARKNRNRFLTGAMMALALTATASTALQANEITLKLAEQFQPTHYISQICAQRWMERVTELTNGKVTFQHFPSQTLGKASDMLDVVSLGVADVGYLAFNAFSAKMPLINGATAFPVWPDAAIGGEALYAATVEPGPILENDFLKNNIRPLIPIANGIFRLWTREKPVHGLDDIKGMKLRSAGGAQDAIVRSFGAIPVNVPAPEIYEALQRGITDGIFMPSASVKSYHVDEVTKFAHWNVAVSGGVRGYVINEKVWQGLPEDVRTAMTVASKESVDLLHAEIVRRDETLREEYEKNGLTFYDGTHTENESWIKAQEPVEEEWFKEMAEKGYPQAAEVLADLRERVAKVMAESQSTAQ